MGKQIKVRCTLSHEIPLGAGRFIPYTKGTIYAFPEGGYDPKFFTPVNPAGATRKKTEVKNNVTRE